MLSDWIEKLLRFNRLIVGFSGGLDSTVLLHALHAQPVLAKRLMAVHINHGLSANALSWQIHCQQVCQALGIAFVAQSVELKRNANIEEAARNARYQVFESVLQANDCLLLGHHLDDQAETLLLQLFRGAGVDGLSAMACEKPFAQGFLLRPLLQHPRQALMLYAQSQKLQWIEDESNQDDTFSRNYLRQQIMPLLSSRWPQVSHNLVRTTLHCQQAQANLDDLARLDCLDLKENSPILPLRFFASLTVARISNLLRVWFKLNEVKLPNTKTFNRIINEVIQAKSDAAPQVSWGDVCVRRYQNALYLLKSFDFTENFPRETVWATFPHPLHLGGQIGHLQVTPAEQGFVVPTESQVVVRFRQGGELFNWRGQTKQLKKLFQEWQVPPWLRPFVPLLYVNGQLASVVGYAVSDVFYGTKRHNQPVVISLHK